MGGIILILFFVILLALPGFYIIMHAMFPRGSKKKAMWISILLTALLATGLVILLIGTI